ncbi:MAG TPA: FAD-binding protein [Gemmatimonadaceae bacterium]|nr:FAD-binding protein [Gemmatimonadaceae bacterium]
MVYSGTFPARRAGARTTALARDIRGEVILPAHEQYDRARRVFNGAVDRRPHAIVRVSGVEDILTAVSYARENDLPLSVRGGGHHVGGFAVVDGGVMIDLSCMRGVIVDAGRRVARVYGGAVWSDVDRATQAHGLATPGGTVASVGVGGFTLGGGIGRLSRAYGLAADNLLSAQLVTADGRLVTVSETENESLFWALRGGGGGFGVVTSFELRLHEMPNAVWSGALIYRIEDASRVLRVMRDLMLSPSRELSLSATIVRREGQLVLVVNPFWIGDASKVGEAIVPFRRVATPIVDGVAPTSYLALQSTDVPGGRRGWESSAFLDQMFDDTIDALVAHAVDASVAAPRIALLPIGGAIADVPESATAFGGRGAAWLVCASSSWEREAGDAEARAWIEEIHAVVRDDSTGNGYVNMLGDRARAHSSWATARLRAVKAVWDPFGVWS